MFPDFSLADASGVLTANVEHLANFDVTQTLRTQEANFTNVWLSKLGRAVCFSPSSWFMAAAAFGYHIGRVVGMRAEKQVSRIYARSNVAFMKTLKILGNWSIVKKPTYAMGFGVALVVAKESVARGIECSHPQPAPCHQDGMNWTILVDLFPESFFWREFCGLWFATPTVTHTVAHEFTFDIPAFWTGIGYNTGFLTTTTVAVTVGYIVRGIIGAHKKLAFLVSNPGAFLRRRLVFLLRFCSFILAQTSGLLQREVCYS